MGKVLSFKPQSNEASQNFADYVASAQYLPFIRAASFTLGDSKWDHTGLAKPERAGQKPIINYNGLLGPFADFGRALVSHQIAENFGNLKQIGRYTKPVARLRDLVSVSESLGIQHPSDLTLEVFDDTAAALATREKSKYNPGQQTSALNWIFEAPDEAALLNVPFDWDPPDSYTKNARRRINPEKRGRPLRSSEIEALALAFRKAQTPRDLLMTSIMALLCCAPVRVWMRPG